MDNLKLIGISAVVSLVVAVVALATGGGQTITRELGAVSSPDIMSPYFSFGDVRHWAGHDTINQASTTICSIQSPAATSTLVFGSVAITTGTTTGIALELGKDSVMDATTTRLGYKVLASGELITFPVFVASTTGSYSNQALFYPADPTKLVFGPNQYFNVKYGGANGALNVLVGTCDAVWIEN